MIRGLQQERAAVEAVANHFAATWREGVGPPDAFLTIAGKRIAVEVTTMLGRRSAAVAKPRLRFDKVALGLVGRLRANVGDSVPDGKAVIVTITAPIRLASKTAAALEERIRKLLADRSAQPRFTGTIHANRIRVHVIEVGSHRTSKLIGFVHNPDSDPSILFDVTRSLLACIGPKLGARTSAGFAEDRWLVIANEDGRSHIDTVRQIYSQIALADEFQQVLMVLASGQVETLSARAENGA